MDEIPIACPECSAKIWKVYTSFIYNGEHAFIPDGLGVKFKCANPTCHYEESLDIIMKGFGQALNHSFAAHLESEKEANKDGREMHD